MAYTTIDKPTDYFNTVLYTGTGSSNAISGIGFAPDWVWIKNRGLTAHHMLFDKVRGATKVLYSNLTDAETTVSGHLTSFDSDGFTLGDNSGKGSTNGNTETYVGWNWLAGGTASSNTDGSITSSVSASTTAGFSIVSYTGTGSTATIGHGLGSAPLITLIKQRSSGGTGSGAWNFITYQIDGSSDELTLNGTGAKADRSITAPTSSVFSVDTSDERNDSGQTYICYCFAEKKGYSKFGSYTGNGNADGTFVYTGFKPAWLMVKRTNSSESWHIFDNKRDINENNIRLQANSSGADDSSEAGLDMLSNGFKVRTSWGGIGGSGDSYIYMAFAESPFVNSNGVPTNAR
jgi:hypothetical protein